MLQSLYYFNCKNNNHSIPWSLFHTYSFSSFSLICLPLSLDDYLDLPRSGIGLFSTHLFSSRLVPIAATVGAADHCSADFRYFVDPNDQCILESGGIA